MTLVFGLPFSVDLEEVVHEVRVLQDYLQISVDTVARLAVRFPRVSSWEVSRAPVTCLYTITQLSTHKFGMKLFYTSAEMNYSPVNDPVLFVAEPKFRVRSLYMAFHPFIRQIIVTFLQLMLCDPKQEVAL